VNISKTAADMAKVTIND